MRAVIEGAYVCIFVYYFLKEVVELYTHIKNIFRKYKKRLMKEERLN